MSIKSGRMVDGPHSISDVVKNSNFTFNYRHADKLVKYWDFEPSSETFISKERR
jgi:hypothetical protein